MAEQKPKTGRWRWFKEPQWMRGKLLLIAAGTATAGLVALAVVLALVGGGDDEAPVLTNPTPAPGSTALIIDTTGPPPLPGEPTVTASGLKIIDIVAGTGAQPKKGDTVSIDYNGWLSDGTKFDSTLERGGPVEFTLGVGDLIEGADEGISTMKVGGKRRLIMNGDLAYGEEGRPPIIPPNAEITFDVELLEVKVVP